MIYRNCIHSITALALSLLVLCPAHTMRFLSLRLLSSVWTTKDENLATAHIIRLHATASLTKVFRRWHPGHGDPGGLVKCLIVIGLLMRRASCLVFHSLTLCDVDQMTARTRSTVVGPIRFSNRSNCRVVASTKDGCRPRAHTARFYVSFSLRPTKDKNRIVWARH